MPTPNQNYQAGPGGQPVYEVTGQQQQQQPIYAVPDQNFAYPPPPDAGYPPNAGHQQQQQQQYPPNNGQYPAGQQAQPYPGSQNNDWNQPPPINTINDGGFQSAFSNASVDQTDIVALSRDALASQVMENNEEMQQMMQTQQRISEQNARVVTEDQQAQTQRVQALNMEIQQQVMELQTLQDQQTHILKLLNIREKVAEQHRALQAFREYQNNYLSVLDAPMKLQSEAINTLQSNQTYLLRHVAAVNIVPKKPAQADRSTFPFPKIEKHDHRIGHFYTAPDPTTSHREINAKYSNEPTSRGGLQPHPNHNPNMDAKRLRKAMRGWGTNEKMLYTIIGTRTNSQRQAVAQAYNTNYKRDLLKDIRSETSGNFKDLLIALMLPPSHFDAVAVRKAVKGLGTDDHSLIELLCTRSNNEINAMKEAYKTVHGRDVIGDVKGDTSGSYQKLLLSILMGDRDEGHEVDEVVAKEDASRLYRAGEARLGTDEATFIEILTKRGFPQLRATFDQYNLLDEYDIEKSIGRETSFMFKKALTTIVKAARSRPRLFAELLYKSMKGFGTRDQDLIRAVVSRSEIDIRDISKEFHDLYKRSLEDMVRKDTSGNYRKLLMELLYCDGEFNPDLDAKRLRKAMKGWGTNEGTLNMVIGNRSNEQRQIIKETYENNYKRSLVKDLKSETSGDYKGLLVALMEIPINFTATEVKRAVKGLGTNDSALIEILCSQSGYEMRQLREAYEELFGQSMAHDVRSDTSGTYQRLLVSLIENDRDDNEEVNTEKAMEEAARLYQAGENKIGTDESVFINVLSSHGWDQLRAIFDAYAKLCDYDIEKSIKRETSFNFKAALVSIVKVVRDPQLYFAERLKKTMKGLGTRDRDLTRIIVLRSEKDLKEIGEAYFKKYKRSLEMDIAKDTSRQFKKLLIRVLDYARRHQSELALKRLREAQEPKGKRYVPPKAYQPRALRARQPPLQEQYHAEDQYQYDEDYYEDDEMYEGEYPEGEGYNNEGYNDGQQTVQVNVDTHGSQS